MNPRQLVCCCSAIVLLSGCGPDLGLGGNVPIADATDMPPPPLVRQTVLAGPDGHPEPFELQDRTWLPSERPFPGSFTQSLLTAIGSADGRSVLALAWDGAPHDRLYTRQDGHLQEFRPLHGVGAPARHGSDTGDESAH